MLFLYTQDQEKPAFDFLPYRFGCYSPQATQDLKTMMKYGQVDETQSGWSVLDSLDYRKTLKKEDIDRLHLFYRKFSKLRGKPLVKFVYETYPFYAIKSEIAETILNKNQWNQVVNSRPTQKETLLFTIGYEGKTVESYVTELIRENVQILCDVRKNPLSMKFGFSKAQLKSILETVGIEYVHIPGLGIDSDKRQGLNSQKDYEKLFFEYEKSTLTSNSKDLKIVADLFREKGRIALTCFEADPNCCHRSRTAKKLLDFLPKKTKLNHL
ncbi:DUF488 family protein [Leptospira santarosai]|uniref:DUF488 domain-containing protein n=1 Tax=Leptospira santarosai TaxID=28183 RepID=UPI001F221EA7|nr:DUF488 domain-containing protein [Leptospira santarosai]